MKKFGYQQLLAIVLVLAGAAGLIYGGFTYTNARHTAEMGPLTMSVDERKHVIIPVWVGIAGIAIGGLLLFVPRKT